VPADVHAQPLDADLPDTGGAILHSSWDKGDLAVGFKAGPYGGRVNFERIKTGGAPGGALNWGHDRNDAMSFWIFGSGTWLAPETMGFAAGSLNWANPANQTAYHNGMLIDGQGELGEVRTSDTEWNNPWFWKRDASPLLTAVGTADYAIAGGRGASLFDWIAHFADGVSLVDTANGWVQGIDKNGQSLGVRVISPAQWTATTGSADRLAQRHGRPRRLDVLGARAARGRRRPGAHGLAGRSRGPQRRGGAGARCALRRRAHR
jgi:hypothetical protein